MRILNCLPSAARSKYQQDVGGERERRKSRDASEEGSEWGREEREEAEQRNRQGEKKAVMIY